MTMTRTEEDRLVTTALNRLGMDVVSVFDLIKWPEPYPSAIPVLQEFLPQVQDTDIKEGIVRALTVKEARGKVDSTLVAEFRALPLTLTANIGLKWAIGNALAVVATDAVFSELVEFVKAKEHGKAREMIAVALGNMKNPKAVDVLLKLLEDDEIAGHALMGLSKLKVKRAKPYIERLLTHPKPWIRKEATKALTKLSK